MKVLVIEPNQKPYAKEVSGTLKSLQGFVGGLVQAIYPFEEENIALLCNEEGKLLGLPLNRALRNESGKIYDVISGTFLLCSAPSDSDKFESLSEEQIKRYTEKFEKIELFIRR